MMNIKHADSVGLIDLSGIVIGCGFAVLNVLGDGFLESALEIVFVNAIRRLSQNYEPVIPPAA